MWAVKLCTNKILQFLTGDASSWCRLVCIMAVKRRSLKAFNKEVRCTVFGFIHAVLFSSVISDFIITCTHTHTRLTALCPGLPRWAGTRKAKPIWILLKQETVSGSGISWTVCKCAPCSRQITMPAPHHSVFTGRMPFLPPNQQRQSTEGIL